MTAPFEDIAGKSLQGISTANGVPFWGDAPETWETVVVAGLALPGVCSIDGKVRRRHDKKNTAGTNGSTVTYIGDDQAEFSVVVRMWTPEHLASYGKVLEFLRRQVVGQAESNALTFDQTLKLIISRSEKRTPYSKFPIAPVDIVHPALQLLRIKSAHIIEYGLPKPKGEAADGVYEAVIHFLEYVPGAKGGVVTPPGALDLSTRYGKGALGEQLEKMKKPSTVNGAKP